MEERNFKWLLYEIVLKKPKLHLLDLCICAGEHLVQPFLSEPLHSRLLPPAPEPHRIKHFLMDLLEWQSPKLSEFNPHRPLCLVYQRTGLHPLTVQGIVSLPSTRIYSMGIKSIHIVPATCANLNVYRASTSNQVGELRCVIVPLLNSPQPNAFTRKKVQELGIALSEFVYKSTSHIVQKMTFDILIDSAGSAFLIRAQKLLLVSGFPQHIRRPKRTLSTGRVQGELRFEINSRRAKFTTQATLSQNRLPKVRSSHYLSSVNFMEMVAKTIDKERRVENKKCDPIFDQARELVSIGELLREVELTRPRVWFKDVSIHKSNPHSQRQALSSRKLKAGTHSYAPSLLSRINIYRVDAALRKDKRQAGLLTSRSQVSFSSVAPSAQLTER